MDFSLNRVKSGAGPPSASTFCTPLHVNKQLAKMPVKMNGQYSQSCSTLPRAANGKRNRSALNRSSPTSEGGGSKRNSVAGTSYTRLERHPSQANMWSTTVPQSLVNQKLGSRHAPTRNSLRHSRMLVLSRSPGGVVPRKYLPPVLEQIKLGTFLVALQFIIGLILTGLACYVLIWSPQLATQDLPHYSGLIFLLSGWFGLMLMICCRHHYPGARHAGCVFPVKPHYIAINVIITFLSLLFGLFASILHSFHFFILMQDPLCSELPIPFSAPEWFYNMKDLHSQGHLSCRCESNSSSFILFDPHLEYPGLPCSHVHAVLPTILGMSAILNLIASFGALWFAILLLKSRGKPPGPQRFNPNSSQYRSPRGTMDRESRNSRSFEQRRRSVV